MQFQLLLASFVWFLSVALGVPNVGINLDYYDIKTVERGSVSFSSQIIFEDKSIPDDPNELSDGQLINLAKIAYKEMVDLWGGVGREDFDCPSAMVAMVSEGSIYFASSIVLSTQDKILSKWEEVEGSPANYIVRASMGFFSHRYGGCCAEVNGLLFYSQQNDAGQDQPFKKPPQTDTGPRVAVWLRPQYKHPSEGKEFAADPCGDSSDGGWGCIHFKEEDGYGLKPVKLGDPDDRGQDDWKFEIATNKRANCPPKQL